jgi:peptidoglycan-N-acetylglucosamine deacetylase
VRLFQVVMYSIRVLLTAGVALAAIATASAAQSAECPGNPDAIGTSRTIVVDPIEHPRIGAMQYGESLPLADKEVVLTFDDAPVPRYSGRVLEILASECVKATYFIVGKQAQVYPDMVRRIAEAGHTIGTHSQTHPLTFSRMPAEKVAQEIEGGIASVTAALGDKGTPGPFFRIPGLARGDNVEAYLTAHQLMTWSADLVADDWLHRIRPSEIIRRALERLEARGKGILLLHDIHPATVLALPGLLKELKQRGYHIVQVVPAGPDRPKTATEAAQWAVKSSHAHTPPIIPVGLDESSRAQNSGGFDFITPAAAAESVASRPDTAANAAASTAAGASEPPARSWPLIFTASWPKAGVP